MYPAVVVALMGAFPIASIAIEAFVSRGGVDVLVLVGKWFVFWSVGARLLLAGARQIVNPSFTANAIFGLKETGALVIVQELGFANVSIGILGALTLATPTWIAPAAIVGGLFFGLAGAKHLTKGDRNANENIAMISDLWIFLVLAGFLAATAARSRGWNGF